MAFFVPPADLGPTESRINALDVLIAAFRNGYNNVIDAIDAKLAPVADSILALQNSTPQFVSGGLMTVAQLQANYPANAANRGKYARISNYGGFVDRVVRCDYDSGLNYYFWTPTQPEYGRSVAMTGDITLYALTSPQSIVLTGSIAVGVSRTVTVDIANRRPGEIVEIRANLTTLLGNLNVLGTGLGAGVNVLLGNYVKFVVDGTNGSLQLVRLV